MLISSTFSLLRKLAAALEALSQEDDSMLMLEHPPMDDVSLFMSSNSVASSCISVAIACTSPAVFVSMLLREEALVVEILLILCFSLLSATEMPSSIPTFPMHIGSLPPDMEEAVEEPEEHIPEVVVESMIPPLTLLLGDEHAELLFVLLVHSLDMNSFGVIRPSYVPESGLGHIEEGDWQTGEEPRLSVNIFFNGGWEYTFQLLPVLPSSNSNLRLTGPNCDGRIAMGDIDRLVAKVRLVGDGDKPYGSRIPARLFVGLGLEQLVTPDGKETWSGLLKSSDLQDQFSATRVKSSQLWDICMALCSSRS